MAIMHETSGLTGARSRGIHACAGRRYQPSGGRLNVRRGIAHMFDLRAEAVWTGHLEVAEIDRLRSRQLAFRQRLPSLVSSP
jgi:hypothetical protein